MKAAAAMGRFIAGNSLIPDRILCSPARRAHQTCELVCRELPFPPPIETIEQLYDFGDGDAVLNVLRGHAATAGTLMLVGHNPAFENLARRLVGGGASKLGRRREEKFPTAALAVIDFPCARWSDIGEGSGHLAHFVRPRDLAQD